MTVVGIGVLALLAAALVGSGYAMYRFVVIPQRRTVKYAVSVQFRDEDIRRRQRLTVHLGRESGREPGEGTGDLVLTADRLWFFHAASATKLDVPLKDIVEVDLASTHLGKRTGPPLLLVRFRTDEGNDSTAFHLPYPDEWRLAIDNLRH